MLDKEKEKKGQVRTYSFPQDQPQATVRYGNKGDWLFGQTHHGHFGTDETLLGDRLSV